ncbi:hypothetical protein CMEL01_15717 [Colletotrichum melonis]|uniref:Uncharacterized protein n=1 Tax=Colletotrichum melonis TaxID=1209925 RepID=A0AAI9XPE0_9PEZI|nr:hypothetical protein CMEL01_15717 [Colletotrichum melonis]
MSKNARRDETRGASARLGQKMTLEGGHEPERRNVSCASGCVGCVGNSLKNWWEMRRCVWRWRGPSDMRVPDILYGVRCICIGVWDPGETYSTTTSVQCVWHWVEGKDGREEVNHVWWGAMKCGW